MQEGLAQQAAGMGTGNVGQQMPTLEELVILLSQGITPEELIAAGVPREMVEEAVRVVKQQAPAKKTLRGMGNTPMTPEGLAASAGM